MALFIVPAFSDSPNYLESVVLDGKDYLIKVDYSAREDEWYLSIFDQDENPLALSIKIVVGMPLLIRETSPALPPGILMAVDLAGNDADPAADDFGSRVLMLYEGAV